MAGRFMFLGRSSLKSRSGNLVGSHDSAFARDVAPATRLVSELTKVLVWLTGGIGNRGFNHGTAAQPSTVVPSFHRIQGYEGRIDAHSSLLLKGASAHPTSVVGIHGHAARLFSTLLCSCSAAKTSSPTTGLPMMVTYRAQPAYLDSARGVKQFFSSNSVTKDPNPLDPQSALEAEIKAQKAALVHQKAQLETERKASQEASRIWRAKLDKNAAEFNRIIGSLVGVWILVGVYGIFQAIQSVPGSSRDGEGERSQLASSES